MPFRQRTLITITLLCLLLALLPMAQSFDSQLSQLLKVTLTVYALARGLNAVISVAQGTEMSVEPMGVGLTLTPGEILDPLNDLIEQFSSVLLLASASLGVQKILLLLGDQPVVQITLCLLALLTLAALMLPKLSLLSGPVLLKLLLVLTILRLLIPGLALVSHQTQQWLQTERQQAISVLQSTQQNVDKLNEDYQQDKGWFGELRQRLDIQQRLDTIKNRSEQGVEAAVYLLAEFVLIMVILPLLFVWLSLSLIRRITLH